MSETSTTRTKAIYEVTCPCGISFRTTRRNVVYHSNYCRQTILRQEAKKRRTERLAKLGHHAQSDFYVKAELSGFVCYWCGISLIDRDGLFTGEKDHLTPVCRGGSDLIQNIAPSCHSCNREKRTRTAEEYTAFLQAKADARKVISAVSTDTGVTSKEEPADTIEKAIAKLVRQTRMPIPVLPDYRNKPQQVDYQKRRAELARQVAIINGRGELWA